MAYSAPELPAYSPALSVSPTVRTVHHYTLLDKNKPPWVTLTVRRSRAPNAMLLPFFVQGDLIEGVVDLNLEQERHIEEIEISIAGSVTLAATDVFVFLEVRKVLWSTSMGDPRLGSSSSSSSSNSRHSGRLQGKYSFPFSVRLPSAVELRVKGMAESQTYSLPPSFSERDSSAHIQYQLMVKVRRVIWPRVRVSSKVGTSFGYIPLKKPGTPSVLRRYAYRENIPLFGLDSDPGGWHTLEPVIIRGIVFNSRDVEIVCTLSLGNPMSYTRGTAIPCLMTITTTDSQALDLLSSPKAMVVHLIRRNSLSVATESKQEDDVKAMSSAAWWPSNEGERVRNDSKSTLFGEIRLEKKLKPSCLVAYFKLAYHVIMFPPKSVAFTYYGNAASPVLSQEVEIVAAYADGPRARIYSPPGYDSEPLPPPFGTGTYLWRSMGDAPIVHHGFD